MNYRPHPSKAFGNHSYDQHNQWLSEEGIFNLRRQTAQFHPAMQNVPPAMHPPYLNQNTQSSSANKNFMNQNPCNMSNYDFTCTPNPEVFKSPHPLNDLGFQNRLIGDRFPSSSYSHINMQHKMNDDLLYKDLPSPNMSHQFPKNDGFSENSQKLFSNMRSPIERFSCMQKDPAQFNRKYENSQVFQGKDFPFSNKEMQSQLPVSFIDKVAVSVASNFPPCKSNYKSPGLFPAYTPKDSNESSFHRSQNVQDEISKKYCDKSSLSSRYSKVSDSFSGKSGSFQERDISLNEVFPPESNSQSYLHEKSPFKPLSNSPVPQDSPLKALETSVSSSNSKFPFSSGNQDACFQSSNEIPFQTSQSMQIMNHSNNSTSRDYLMQNVPFSTSGTSLPCIGESTTISSQFSLHQSSKETFSSFDASSQSDVQQNNSFIVTSGSNAHPSTKETFSSLTVSSQPNIQQNSQDSFSSFNFGSNMNSTDISDLLPGLDAFLKETCKSEDILSKSESLDSKSVITKSSVSNCAFDDDDDELSKHSIPFIGDTQTQGSSNNTQSDIKLSYCDQTTVKNDFESEKSTDLKLDVNNDSSSSVKPNAQKDTTVEKDTSKTQSALEEAIDLLVKCDAIVGLDYITEYKKNISLQGSFPFRCKLCNSSITRPSIIDHIIGSKHRMRYIKTKNESTYEHIVSLKLDKADKDAKIAEAAFHMELLYGRGSVTVNADDYQAEISSENKSKEIGEQMEEPVFTLDKIPIGFEALSPQHEEMDSSAFPLESDLNPVKQEHTSIEKEASNVSASTEIYKEAIQVSKTDSVFKLTGLGDDESLSHYGVKDLKLEKHNTEVTMKLSNSEKDESSLHVNPELCQVKRSLSPAPSCSTKILKAEFNEKSETCTDMLVDEKSTIIKTEDSPSDEKKAFMVDILEEFSKNVISSDEEALMIVKIIGMLVQMLLRYDLPHMSVEKLENMLSSLQVSSSEKHVIEDLKSLLNGSKIHNEIKEDRKQEMGSSLQGASGENIEQTLSANMENRNYENNDILYEPNVSVSNINVLSNNGPSLMLNSNVSLSVFEKDINTAVQTSVAVSANTTEVSKTTSDMSAMFVDTSVNSQTVNTAGLKPPPFPDLNASSSATSALNTAGLKPPTMPELNLSTVVTSSTQSTVSSAGLKPPPFFSWPQKNETNPVSYANVQSTQNMMWSNAYQYSQQYAPMSYYQPQSYGSHFSGTQSYQSQFSIIPQPPAPPLPPPPPSNPPLPPSVPLPANPHLSVPFNQPPPPPLP